VTARARHGQASAEKLLQAQPLFRALPAGTLARLAATATRRELRRGELLFSAGEKPTGMYVVVYGAIRLLARAGSRARLTGVVRAGRSLGEPVMFLDRPAPVNAVAADDSLVLHLPRTAIVDELARNPEFALQMLAALSARIERLVQELEHQAGGSGRERLVRYLAACAVPGDSNRALLPASKASIASQLRMTPEHLSRLLRELRSEGLIAVRGREITVTDRARLDASGKSQGAADQAHVAGRSRLPQPAHPNLSD
jgi:CRP/FNR family transcriptional regulator, dissimilatory nitrate respiration regulator